MSDDLFSCACIIYELYNKIPMFNERTLSEYVAGVFVPKTALVPPKLYQHLLSVVDAALELRSGELREEDHVALCKQHFHVLEDALKSSYVLLVL